MQVLIDVACELKLLIVACRLYFLRCNNARLQYNPGLPAHQKVHVGLGADNLFFIVQMVKNLPSMQETLVQFLGQEDPLEKG